MDNEELVDVEVSPSEITSTTTADTETTAPVVNEQHAEENATVENKDTDTTDDTSEVKVDNQVKVPSERELMKMSKLEKERNEIAIQLDETKRSRYYDTLELLQNESTREKVNNRYASDPKAYEEFRQQHKKLTGEDLGEHANRYTQNTQAEHQQGYQNRAYVDPATLKQQLKTELRVEQEAETAAKEFWRNVPEMDPNNARTEEDIDVLKHKAGVIETIAGHYKILNPGISLHEAYIEAWNSLPENRDKQVQVAKESGELIGMAKALSSGSSSTTVSGGSQTTPTQPTSYKLTPAERNHYEDMKKSDPKKAEKYAKYADSQRRNATS